MLARRSIVFLCCLLAAASASAASIYSVTPLGILPGGYASSTATSIDNQGEVAGYSSATNGQSQAFYWTQGGGLVGLGGDSQAFGVNSGTVVGQYGGNAFRWTSAAGVVTLDDTDQANSINSSGVAVGTALGGNLGGIPFYWSPGNDPTSPLFLVQTAVGNDLGQIAGITGSGGGYYFEGGSNASVLNLGGLRVTCLSDTQFVAGSLNSVAVFENLHDQSITTIGTLAGDPTANALGINPLGTQVIGVSAGHGGFLYDIATSDLESLTYLLDPAFIGWNILSASAVNDNGQIVGMGEFNGVQQAVLLTPVPEPSTMILAFLALVGLVAHSLRRQSKKLAITSAFAVTLTASANAAQYSVTDLGVLPGYVSPFFPYEIG